MKNKKTIIILCVSIVLNFYGNNTYQYFINLNKISNYKILVTLLPPSVDSANINFSFPAIVPGTYEINNFGKYITNFNAFNRFGEKLKIEKLDSNTFRIFNAQELTKITYYVEDTWHNKKNKGEVFEPASLNLDTLPNSAKLINTHCLFGYFEGKKKIPFKIQVEKPNSFYGATSIQNIKSTDNIDVFISPNYHLLIDSPILYSIPDTCSFTEHGSKISISVYAADKKINSTEIKTTIQKIISNYYTYLGNKLTAPNYHFLFMFSNNLNSQGALEHSYSSIYSMPEINYVAIEQNLKQFVAHEYYHTITPLILHSKEIENFNFNTPKMSKHLWLYEGVTEYISLHMQAVSKLISVEEFLDELSIKNITMRNFNKTLPFTQLSLQVLDKCKKEYSNVYVKGALLAMCMDITLLKHSEGKYNLQNLINDLCKTYNNTKPFDDDILFDEIEKLTNKNIRYFINQYIDGPEMLNVESFLEFCGIELKGQKNETYKVLSINNKANTQQIKLRNAWLNINTL